MLKNQIYLGSDQFIEQVQNKYSGGKSSEIPRIQKRPVAKSLEQYELIATDRNRAILLAYRSGGYTLSEIGGIFHFTIQRLVELFIAKIKSKDLTPIAIVGFFVGI